MLSETEKKILSEFLQVIPPSDLISLSSTVSGGNLKTTNVEEAHRAILQHTDNLQRILDRKIVKKQYIYNYLQSKQVSLLSSGMDKNYLVRKTMEIWTQTPKEPMIMENYVSELSHAFVHWFYNLINDSDMTKFGPEHFFSNSDIKIRIQTFDAFYTFEDHGSNECVNLINNIRIKYNYKFVPHVPRGLQFKEDEHGFILIGSKGNLQSESQVNGIFDQLFVLLRDPEACDNFKITKTEINIIIHKLPVFCENSVETIALT